MKNFFLIVGLIPLLIACQNPKYQEGITDLARLDLDMDMDDFYEEAMDDENIKMMSDRQFVMKDTVMERDLSWEGDPGQIFGMHYRVISSSPKDWVASYKSLEFSLLEAMATETGQLMGVVAVGRFKEDDFKTAVEKLTDRYGEPEMEEIESSFFKNRHYTWRLKDRVLQLVSDTTIDFEQSSNLFTEEEKDRILEIEKDHNTNMHLYLCKPEYEEVLRGEVGIGEWSEFR